MTTQHIFVFFSLFDYFIAQQLKSLMTNTNYYTCGELLKMYPTTKYWGWSTTKIGLFYRCLLIDGHPFGGKKRIRVSEKSFENLMNYKIELDQTPMFCGAFLTYEEILEEIPQAEYYRWNPTVIGILKSAGLLVGKRLGKESANAISESSAKALIQFTTQRFVNIGKML